ncbi:MAG: IS110 family transposase [bacterium]|nr:IS110 family transposase [bacterium]
MGRYIGVDLHKNNFTVCYMNEREEHKIQSFRVDAGSIGMFQKSLSKSDEVAVESTGNTAYFVREIDSLVKTVKIINPTQFKVISQSIKKTDERDAATIARYLSKGLIPEVRMRSKEESQVASLISTRDKFVKLRSALKNKVHNILNANGIVTKREIFGSEKGLERVLNLNLDSSYLFELRIIVDQIRNLNKSIDEINKEMSDRGKKIKGHKNLKSITGIGDISATILLNAIGNVNDFDSDKKLAAYFGIVPRVYISNQTSHYGRITKMGNKIARTALVQSTLIAIRYNNYLRNFYLRLKTKKGSGKAIIATARKLLGIIYRTLKNDWVFENFNEFTLVTNN